MAKENSKPKKKPDSPHWVADVADENGKFADTDEPFEEEIEEAGPKQESQEKDD